MDFTKLQNFLDCLTAFDIHEFDISVRLNHKEVYRYLWGYADEEKTRPVTKNNMRWLYSMSKVVTVTAVLRLVERGLLGLDDKVSKYLPEYETLYVKNGDETVKAEKPMLIRHLFSMQSGLSYDLNSPSLKRARENSSATTRELVRALAKDPLGFEPGDKFQYSLSHDVLAAVAEVISGKTWHEYLKDEIFIPLDMKNIGFHPTAEQKALFTQQYVYNNSEFIATKHNMDNGYILSTPYESGGAGLFATADDYMKVIDALANFGTAANGYQVLKPKTVELLRTNQVPENDCAFKRGYGYALGVRTMVDKKSARSLSPLGEFGWDGAANSYNMADPKNGLAIGFFTHIVGTGFFNDIISPQIKNLVYEALGLAESY